MNAKLRSIFFAFAALAVSSVAGAKSVELPPNAGRDAFRQIVQDQCVMNWKQHKNPQPCERVFLADPKFGDSGYALLADPAGGAHYLLIPTQTMRGVEGSELLDPDAPNYFAEAWHSRDLISKFVGHDVPRTAIGLVVNTVRTRTQDQFHIHISCLRPDVVDSLRAASELVPDIWLPVSIAGSTYQALLIVAPDLGASNLFELLAKLNPNSRRHMGDYTLIVAGMQLRAGLGFIALTGTGPTGEMLLDSACTVAGGGG